MSRIHYRIAVFTSGGMFCDGYILGIVSIALAVYAPQVGLDDIWSGLIGASALIGLFIGSLAFGPVIDRIGRQVMFLADLLLFIGCSLLHIVATEPWQLFAIRLVLGIAMGIDYAIAAPLLSEFLPRRQRGGILATLNAVWTVGFVAAFVTGYALRDLAGDGSWRWMLASSGVPAIAVLLMRLGAPESPRWLTSCGRHREAREVLDKHFGTHVDVGEAPSAERSEGGFRLLFSRQLRTRTAFASIFWFCQVLPYFAIFTFSPTVLASVGLGNGFLGGLLLNVFQLVGGVVGVVLVARLPRRGFTTWSFVLMALCLLPLGLFASPWPVLIAACFSIYGAVISAAGNLCHVYPAELFPTHIRATGVGFAAAMSRVGAAAGTFLLPLSLAHLGTRPTMLLAVVVLALGAAASALWAPETKDLALHDASDAQDSAPRPDAGTPIPSLDTKR
ncbi:MFS transporter [Streptomyces sp. NPDC001508]|uniref:MFS transporter n=1 Tax=Streptomyces sp. NPDC001508 TaxID=3154656 RepID=UPI003324971F